MKQERSYVFEVTLEKCKCVMKLALTICLAFPNMPFKSVDAWLAELKQSSFYLGMRQKNMLHSLTTST